MIRNHAPREFTRLDGFYDLIPNTGLNAGFEVIFEPQSKLTPLISAN